MSKARKQNTLCLDLVMPTWPAKSRIALALGIELSAAKCFMINYNYLFSISAFSSSVIAKANACQ